MKRKILVLGIAFLGYYTISFAQEKNKQRPVRQRMEMSAETKTPEQIAERKTQRLDKIVGLDNDQKAKIHAIYLKQAKQTQERMAVRKDEQKEIKSVLNADQNQKLKEVKQDRMEKMETRQNRMQGANNKSMREEQ